MLKDPYEAKYNFSINKWESIRLKHFSNSEAFIEYSNDMDDIYETLKNITQTKT